MNLTANEKNAAVARQKRYVLLLAVMLVLLFIIIVLSFWVGYYPLTPVQVLNAFLSKFGFKGDILPQAVTIFWNIRLPRILSATYLIIVTPALQSDMIIVPVRTRLRVWECADFRLIR